MNPIFPSILTTTHFDLGSRMDRFQSAGITHLHLDVMDGHFVPNMAFGPATVPAVKNAYGMAVDAHLMVDQPRTVVPWFLDAGADWISFHLEVEPEPGFLLDLIRARGCRAGLVINPDTPVEGLFPWLGKLDYVLLMSVFPGYGGQAFMPRTLDRVAELVRERQRRALDFLIQVDGGIRQEEASRLFGLGADCLVVGTYLYNAPDIEQRVRELRDAKKQGRG